MPDPAPSAPHPAPAWVGNAPAYTQVRVGLSVGGFGGVTAVLVVLGAILWSLTGQWWGMLFGLGVTVWGVWFTVTEPRRARAIGYLLRDDDILFRRGLWYRRTVAVPFGRLQLAEVHQGPLDRAAGIASVSLVTASAGSDASIPGLPVEAAGELRDCLVQLAESRRAGL